MTRQNDNYANAICLFADHFAKWKHGAVKADNIIEQIKGLKPKSEGGDGNLKIVLKFYGEECEIAFTQSAVQQDVTLYTDT